MLLALEGTLCYPECEECETTLLLLEHLHRVLCHTGLFTFLKGQKLNEVLTEVCWHYECTR